MITREQLLARRLTPEEIRDFGIRVYKEMKEQQSMPVFRKVTPPATGDKVYKKISDLEVGGTYEGIWLNQYRNDRFDNQVYEIFTLDHELIALNGTTELDKCMGEIEVGTYVQVVLTAWKEFSKTDPETGATTIRKVAKIDVNVAEEDDLVAELRAAAKRVLGPGTSTASGESDADQEARAAAYESGSGGRW